MHCANPVECIAFSVGGITVEHVFNLCHRSFTRAHILTLWLEYFANATVPMHFGRDNWTVIGWCIGILQKSPKYVIWPFLLIVPPSQWYGQICQRLIITVEPAGWHRTCEAQLYTFKSEFFHTRHGNELVPIFHYFGAVLTFDWAQHRLLLLVINDKQNITGNWLIIYEVNIYASPRKRKKDKLESFKIMKSCTPQQVVIQ